MPAVLDLLSEIFKLSEKKSHLDNFLEEFLCSLRNALNSECCQANIYDKQSKEIFNHFSCGTGDKIKKNIDGKTFGIDLLAELISDKSGNEKTFNSSSKTITPNELKVLNDRLGIKIRSLMVVPMRNRGKTLGLLVAVNKKKKPKFSRQDEKLINIFASQAALIIHNSRLFEENLTNDRLSHLGQRIIDSAHGLKNILNNMDGGTYIVEHGTLTKNMKEVNKGWDMIKRNSNRLRELVLDILFFSGPKKPEYKLTDVNNICLDIKELIEPIAKENNIKVDLYLNKSVGLFCLDPKGIYRCILNLVSNSIYACQEKGGGQVSIKTYIDTDNKLNIVVTDNGTGIGKENLEHIFDVFFSTKGSKGTGLGLAVTKKIINEHLGKITVHSELGKGSMFTITLPKNTSSECYQKKQNQLSLK